MSMITEQVKQLRDYADIAEISDDVSMKMCAKAMKEAANTISVLSEKLQAANIERSTAYYNGGWIPVSEKLPEDNIEILVTAYDTYDKKVRTTWYQDKEHGFLCGLVKAWMPLPDAYREDGTE